MQASALPDPAGLIREAVRTLGAGSRKAGIAAAARMLGLRERRVRAWLHGEVRAPREREVACVRAGLRDLLEVQRAQAHAELARLTAMLDALDAGRAR